MKNWLKSIFGEKARRPLTQPPRRPSIPLRLEELESRVVPSATVQFSTGAETVNAATGTFSIPVTVTRAITTFASGFDFPAGLAFDAAGNLYVADQNTNTVDKVTPAGVVSTFASGVGDARALAFDAAGNLYVSILGGAVDKVTPAGVVTTFASGFNNVNGLAFDAAGNLYVANGTVVEMGLGGGNSSVANTISKVTPASVVSTFASGINNPEGLAFSAGNLYVATGNTVSEVTPSGVVSTFASGFYNALGLASDTAGNLYVSDNGPNAVDKVTSAGVVSTFASGFSSPFDLAFDAAGNLYVSNSGLHAPNPGANTVTEVSNTTVTVPFTLGGTAVAGTDYTGVTAGPLVFTPGQTTVDITGTLINDPGASPTLTFTLNTATNAALGSPAVNTLTINEGTADQHFISNIYIDLLHRPVDADGLANWTGLLAQGVSRSQVVLGIEQSNEFYQVEVQAAFQQYLHRAAEPTAAASFANFLAAGNTVEQMDALIVESPEFLNVQGGGTYRGFLNALYQDALGRTTDSSGQQSFGNQTPAVTAEAIFSSNEFHTDLVVEYYANLLDRGVDPGDQAFINALNMSVPDQAVIADIASSPEYYGKTAS